MDKEKLIFVRSYVVIDCNFFQFMFVVFMAIVAILLVNMLIAMMGNTYQKIAETRNEWQRQVISCTHTGYLIYSYSNYSNDIFKQFFVSNNFCVQETKFFLLFIDLFVCYFYTFLHCATEKTNNFVIVIHSPINHCTQWARIVLVVERGVSPAERLKKLMDYSQPMSDGRRALVLRLHQSVMHIYCLLSAFNKIHTFFACLVARHSANLYINIKFLLRK